MTVDIRPLADYEADMLALARTARAATRVPLAVGPYGTRECGHARPRAEAETYAAGWQRELGPEWTVSVLPTWAVER